VNLAVGALGKNLPAVLSQLMPPNQHIEHFSCDVGAAVAGVFCVLNEYRAVLKADVGPGQFKPLARPHFAEQRKRGYLMSRLRAFRQNFQQGRRFGLTRQRAELIVPFGFFGLFDLGRLSGLFAAHFKNFRTDSLWSEAWVKGLIRTQGVKAVKLRLNLALTNNR
jgi:hypothetical protein